MTLSRFPSARVSRRVTVLPTLKPIVALCSRSMLQAVGNIHIKHSIRVTLAAVPCGGAAVRPVLPRMFRARVYSV